MWRLQSSSPTASQWPYRMTVAARRTLHLRFNDLSGPQPVPRDTGHASVFLNPTSPIVVQRTRLGSRHAEVSFSTMAFADGGLRGALSNHRC